MLEIRFDGKTGQYERKASSQDAATVLSEMTAAIVGMVKDVRDEIGHEEAQLFVNVVQKYMKKIDLHEGEGKGLIQ